MPGFIQQRRRLRKIFRVPSASSEGHSYKVVELATASIDDISPSNVARFIVEAISTLCLNTADSRRIHPNKVSVGSNGDCDLGLIKNLDIGCNREWELGLIEDSDIERDKNRNLGCNKISHGAQLRVQPEWGPLEGINCYKKNDWNLLKLENLLDGYIQKSLLRLWSKEYNRRSRFRSQQRRTLYRDQLWLICLVEMKFAIHKSQGQSESDQMAKCFLELDELEQLHYELSQNGC